MTSSKIEPQKNTQTSGKTNETHGALESEGMSRLSIQSRVAVTTPLLMFPHGLLLFAGEITHQTLC